MSEATKPPYYAHDGKVWKRGTREQLGKITHLTTGFAVCTPTEFLGPEDADTIAMLMNLGAERAAMPSRRQLRMWVNSVIRDHRVAHNVMAGHYWRRIADQIGDAMVELGLPRKVRKGEVPR